MCNHLRQKVGVITPSPAVVVHLFVARRHLIQQLLVVDQRLVEHVVEFADDYVV